MFDQSWKGPGEKVIATVFGDAKSTSLVDILEVEKAIESAYYESVSRKLANNLSEKRHGMFHQ